MADTSVMRRVDSILISQPEPESGKSPFYDLGSKHGIQVDFRHFIHVEGVESKDFRKLKVNPQDYSAVIFTSKNAIDHYFRICEDLRVKVSQDTKFFCKSEAIALYLQKYTQYRKRKVFASNNREEGLMELLKKHKNNETFLLPCSDIAKRDLPDYLEKNGFRYAAAVMYQTVVSDLSDLDDVTYDVIVFFSPQGLKSLYTNFPDFRQNNTRIAVWGSSTAEAAREAGLEVNIEAPTKETPSMAMALEQYIEQANK